MNLDKIKHFKKIGKDFIWEVKQLYKNAKMKYKSSCNEEIHNFIHKKKKQ